MILPPHDEGCPSHAGDECVCPRSMVRRYVDLNLAGLTPLIYSVMLERQQAKIITSLKGHATAIANEVRKHIQSDEEWWT